ncbi:PREDICTED: chordin, partial [Pygoscelis adeliae]|uniref:chordin n=1 Tax=Pygoscelis adeliae TaxID=9238 RepID=UPI0004F4F8AD
MKATKNTHPGAGSNTGDPHPEVDLIPGHLHPEVEPHHSYPLPEVDHNPGDPRPEVDPIPGDPRPEVDHNPGDPCPEVDPIPGDPHPEVDPNPSDPRPEFPAAPGRVTTGRVNTSALLCLPRALLSPWQPTLRVTGCPDRGSALPAPLEKSPVPPFDTFEYFQDKEDDLDKPYNDRSYLSSEGLARDDARTEFVALLTSGPEPWHPTSSAVAKARFTLLRSYLLFSISYERVRGLADERPGAVAPHIQRSGQGSLHPVALLPALLHQLRAVWSGNKRERLQGSVEDMGTAGQRHRPALRILPTEGRHARQLAGTITTRRSCDTIQSVLCGADALIPTKTGAVGSAKLALHENGTLEYQVQVVGTASEVVGITLETKPRRKSKRNVLFDMTPSYKDGLARGTWQSPSARDAHMLLQNELFLNVATKDWAEGELRGQVISLPYSGLLARYTEKKMGQEELKLERARDSSEGCYFDGDKTWRGSGTRWHPVVPPFGLIKCAICTCK